MLKGIDCFISYIDNETTKSIVEQLRESQLVNNVFVLAADENVQIEGSETVKMHNPLSTEMVAAMCSHAESEYILAYTKNQPLTLGYNMIHRFYIVAKTVDSALLYSDRYQVKEGKTINAPVTDCFYGSVRDDFDFGSVVMMRTQSVLDFKEELKDSELNVSAPYAFHLYALRNKRQHPLFHLREYLYTEEENDLRKSGEKQFDYVDPRNRDAQIEKEVVFTDHLKKIGAYIDPLSISYIDTKHDYFENEASVIIPVRNRVKTIEDAVRSALSQKADFKFNVIVVDNFSTDGTTEVLENIAKEDVRCIHIIPTRKDLGIGGCWNLAVNDERCGRFAVQLDSDDLYSGTDTLKRIVEKFYEEKCAMVIGSYRMCNFQLETLPPGLIDHKEWTDSNGRNNALRINGLGAPRAFFTPLLRKQGVPNTSYGEDYALGLAFSRTYSIGRIYDELYLCRRWEGNSDAALSIEKVNQNNCYKDMLRTMEIIERRKLNEYWAKEVKNDDIAAFFVEQLSLWPEAKQRYEDLDTVAFKSMFANETLIGAQFNPARMASTGAKIDKKTIASRPCFLCEVNRPTQQIDLPMLKRYQVLVNPFPILPQHFTIPMRYHTPQQILKNYEDMMRITLNFDEYFVFYNGPLCGASAPDHMHFQAGSRGIIPLERDYDSKYIRHRSRLYPLTEHHFKEATKLEPLCDEFGVFSLVEYACPAYVIVTQTPEANAVLFKKVYDTLPCAEGEIEPRMNIITFTRKVAYSTNKCIVSIVIPRGKHRPDCYFAEGEDQCLVSPGALDMGGLLITPREKDFANMTAEKGISIIAECGISMDEAEKSLEKFIANE